MLQCLDQCILDLDIHVVQKYICRKNLIVWVVKEKGIFEGCSDQSLDIGVFRGLTCLYGIVDKLS
jgi:hypothetical protein